jgi:hypothetical protein
MFIPFGKYQTRSRRPENRISPLELVRSNTADEGILSENSQAACRILEGVSFVGFSAIHSQHNRSARKIEFIFTCPQTLVKLILARRRGGLPLPATAMSIGMNSLLFDNYSDNKMGYQTPQSLAEWKF